MDYGCGGSGLGRIKAVSRRTAHMDMCGIDLWSTEFISLYTAYKHGNYGIQYSYDKNKQDKLIYRRYNYTRVQSCPNSRMDDAGYGQWVQIQMTLHGDGDDSDGVEWCMMA